MKEFDRLKRDYSEIMDEVRGKINKYRRRGNESDRESSRSTKGRGQTGRKRSY